MDKRENDDEEQNPLDSRHATTSAAASNSESLLASQTVVIGQEQTQQQQQYSSEGFGEQSSSSANDGFNSLGAAAAVTTSGLMFNDKDDGLSQPISSHVRRDNLAGGAATATSGGAEALMDSERIHPTRDGSINPEDVLCGRGKTSFNHAGNKRFRDAINSALESYIAAENRFEKSMVVHGIVDNIHTAGGRFLKKDFSTGKWYELPDQQSKEKVGHAIRDAVNAYEAREKKKSSGGGGSSTKKLSSSSLGGDGDDSVDDGGEGSTLSSLKKPAHLFASAAAGGGQVEALHSSSSIPTSIFGVSSSQLITHQHQPLSLEQAYASVANYPSTLPSFPQQQQQQQPPPPPPTAVPSITNAMPLGQILSSSVEAQQQQQQHSEQPDQQQSTFYNSQQQTAHLSFPPHHSSNMERQPHQQQQQQSSAALQLFPQHHYQQQQADLPLPLPHRPPHIMGGEGGETFGLPTLMNIDPLAGFPFLQPLLASMQQPQHATTQLQHSQDNLQQQQQQQQQPHSDTQAPSTVSVPSQIHVAPMFDAAFSELPPSQQQQHDDRHFLQQIDAVLGPLHPGAPDPMQLFLYENSTSPTENDDDEEHV